MELCQRILAVPFKRARSRSIEYLEFDEIQAVLTAIDRNTVDGRGDYDASWFAQYQAITQP